ncbi:GIY-YIG nuclease family protein [Mesorhizobium sp. B2-1-8]|uniref:GIY-YIG nuclease family protein n=1 Tax=unclassified Mesorhizobium TaxID=325217 RepID=UPI00112EF7F1|nr:MULTISPECIES: GIY-YIG nuclease family protein [unclassified Mesorhizobium]MBZ9672419.1 GIY-YIG nuclease family protein [Mesorhizobium sp. ES1-3]UCI21882.1 GIY-YIG nuclease family protein [Mesorhizobium sp. B2-1-8]
MKGYVEFEFDLPGALLARLIEVLDRLDAAPLNSASLQAVPEEQGVYQLLLDGQLVYVGKTDAEAGLQKRLSRHARKIVHRVGLDPARVSFRAVRIFVFTAMDLEANLIRHYGGVKAIDWNGSGFGSNDPGRQRDTTKVKPKNYDAKFPIDIDRQMAFAIDHGETASSALARLKEALPYTFRFQKMDSDFDATKLAALSGPLTPRSAIRHIVDPLPQGWQATALPGYIILYKEKRDYPQAEVIAVSKG